MIAKTTLLQTIAVFTLLPFGLTLAYASEQFGLTCSSPDYSEHRFVLSYGKKFSARGKEFFEGTATNYSSSGGKQKNWDFLATSQSIELTLEDGKYAVQIFSIDRFNLSANLMKRDNALNAVNHSFKCRKVPVLQIVSPQKQKI